MELMAGGSLDDLLHNKKQTFSLTEKLNICLNVAAGISFLHSKSIIHRDIKSSNILVYRTCWLQLAHWELSTSQDI